MAVLLLRIMLVYLTCPAVQQWQVRRWLAMVLAFDAATACRHRIMQLSAVGVYPAELWLAGQHSLVLAPAADQSHGHID